MCLNPNTTLPFSKCITKDECISEADGYNSGNNCYGQKLKAGWNYNVAMTDRNIGDSSMLSPGTKLSVEECRDYTEFLGGKAFYYRRDNSQHQPGFKKTCIVLSDIPPQYAQTLTAVEAHYAGCADVTKTYPNC